MPQDAVVSNNTDGVQPQPASAAANVQPAQATVAHVDDDDVAVPPSPDRPTGANSTTKTAKRFSSSERHVRQITATGRTSITIRHKCSKRQ